MTLWRIGKQRMRWIAPLAVALSFGFSAAAGFAHDTPVAITFDDVPLFGLYAPPGEAEQITARLLNGFKRHHWPVTGFVNETQLEGSQRPERTALLSSWLDAGMDLGNHSYSHLSLTNTPVDAYIADVARGERVTKVLLAARGRTEHWYRHPYLETGATPDAKQKFEQWLADHGYRIAPVSMENSDWKFAEVYDQALARGEHQRADQIRQEYLEYTARVIPWYQKAALGLLGREPSLCSPAPCQPAEFGQHRRIGGDSETGPSTPCHARPGDGGSSLSHPG